MVLDSWSYSSGPEYGQRDLAAGAYGIGTTTWGMLGTYLGHEIRCCCCIYCYHVCGASGRFFDRIPRIEAVLRAHSHSQCCTAFKHITTPRRKW